MLFFILTLLAAAATTTVLAEPTPQAQHSSLANARISSRSINDAKYRAAREKAEKAITSAAACYNALAQGDAVDAVDTVVVDNKAYLACSELDSVANQHVNQLETLWFSDPIRSARTKSSKTRGGVRRPLSADPDSPRRVLRGQLGDLANKRERAQNAYKAWFDGFLDQYRHNITILQDTIQNTTDCYQNYTQTLFASAVEGMAGYHNCLDRETRVDTLLESLREQLRSTGGGQSKNLFSRLFAAGLPNIPDKDVLDSDDESDNYALQGEYTMELQDRLTDMLDKKRAAEQLFQMESAIIQYRNDTRTLIKNIQDTTVCYEAYEAAGSTIDTEDRASYRACLKQQTEVNKLLSSLRKLLRSVTGGGASQILLNQLHAAKLPNVLALRDSAAAQDKYTKALFDQKAKMVSAAAAAAEVFSHSDTVDDYREMWEELSDTINKTTLCYTRFAANVFKFELDDGDIEYDKDAHAICDELHNMVDRGLGSLRDFARESVARNTMSNLALRRAKLPNVLDDRATHQSKYTKKLQSRLADIAVAAEAAFTMFKQTNDVGAYRGLAKGLDDALTSAQSCYDSAMSEDDKSPDDRDKYAHQEDGSSVSIVSAAAAVAAAPSGSDAANIEYASKDAQLVNMTTLMTDTLARCDARFRTASLMLTTLRTVKTSASDEALSRARLPILTGNNTAASAEGQQVLARYRELETTNHEAAELIDYLHGEGNMFGKDVYDIVSDTMKNLITFRLLSGVKSGMSDDDATVGAQRLAGQFLEYLEANATEISYSILQHGEGGGAEA